MGIIMEKRPFGKSGMDVTVLGFGGAEIGFEKASATEVARLLGDALDAGLNVIDTAECYLASEELIGQAVSSRRNDYYLFTKCGHPDSYLTANWRPESLLASIERSLKRLKTDRVDLVQLHSCSESDFLRGDPRQAASIALRFTLSIPGVDTMIVGTKNPARWRENAELVAAGPLPKEQFEAIRSRWRQVAESGWTGQT
jgi:aryl-alcohol dehydrogenase-like predicted oxidoreductase